MLSSQINLALLSSPVASAQGGLAGKAEIQPIGIPWLRLQVVDTGPVATYNLPASDNLAAVEVKVYYDKADNTLTVWFSNPQYEYVYEETGDEVVLMKNKSGRVIGFEKLNFVMAAPEPMRVAFEAVAV